MSKVTALTSPYLTSPHLTQQFVPGRTDAHTGATGELLHAEYLIAQLLQTRETRYSTVVEQSVARHLQLQLQPPSQRIGERRGDEGIDKTNLITQQGQT